jgi:type III restriction enzyme
VLQDGDWQRQDRGHGHARRLGLLQSGTGSHLNAVVLDSQWEQMAAFYLEQQTGLVQAYARNERPFLLIPYEYEGVQHHYEPDYVVRLVDGATLVLEVKGEKGDDDRAKHQAARRWVDAVNNWGRLGRWDFLECQDPQLVPQQLRAVVKKEQT